MESSVFTILQSVNAHSTISVDRSRGPLVTSQLGECGVELITDVLVPHLLSQQFI